MTTVQDFLSRKFEKDTATTPPRHAAERPQVPNQDSGPWSTSKVTGHMKNSSFDANGSYTKRADAFNNSSTHALRRAEYQQEFAHGYGLHRAKSSPAVGVHEPTASPEINSYAAYETYEDEDRYAGYGSNFSDSRDLTSSPASRGRSSRARGLGIDSAHLQDVEREERGRVEVSKDDVEESLPAPKRSRSPIKKLFGPGGFLGNTGAPNSPADPRYVKPKTKNGMISKIKTKIDQFVSKEHLVPLSNITDLKSLDGNAQKYESR